VFPFHFGGEAVEKPTSWEKILEHLKSRVDERDFDTWFRGTRQKSETPEAINVLIGSPLFIDYIPSEYGDQIAEAARLAGIGNREIRFLLEGNDGFRASVSPARAQASPRSKAGDLNPLYTFEHFVIGASNQLAHAASLHVADQTSHRYNPLFICGPTGLGKTHLMQAIGHRRLSRRPGERVLYVFSDTFVKDVVSGLRFNRMDQVRQRLLNADVLLFDDVQFLAGKPTTEDELFQTFNTLYAAGSQIVFTSDVLPRDIPGLNDRMKSRFEGGLVVDIQPPDFETKVAILRHKAEVAQADLDDDTAFFLAGKIKTHVRELESYFNRVVLVASMRGEPITRDLAQEALRGILPDDSQRTSPAEILKAVAGHYGLKPAELRARTKREAIVFPRQVAMYVLKESIGLSLPEIGRLFGDKHHTTALHSIRKITSRREEDPDFDREVAALVAQFR
jgi:chromosomal replication initiator protein